MADNAGRPALSTGQTDGAVLRGSGDVGSVCEQHGLRLVQRHPLDPSVWLDDEVKVEIVDGYTAWQVTVRDGMGGLLVCTVGAETRSAELLHLGIAEARRIYQSVPVVGRRTDQPPRSPFCGDTDTTHPEEARDV